MKIIYENCYCGCHLIDLPSNIIRPLDCKHCKPHTLNSFKLKHPMCGCMLDLMGERKHNEHCKIWPNNEDLKFAKKYISIITSYDNS